MNPKITVLMTVYNGMAFLREAIESILDQSFIDFEFLIIDDASTDDSVEFIKSYTDSRIKLILNEKNMGQTSSLNKGLVLAQGEYIARLDQDDVSLPDRLEKQLLFMETHPQYSITSTWEDTIDSQGTRVRKWRRVIDNFGDFLGYLLLGLSPVWHPSVMFRTKDILKLGGFDPSYGPAEDIELWGRMAMARLNAGFVPQTLLYQRVHGQRQSVLSYNKQLESCHRSHQNIINQFYQGKDTNVLAAFLRLDDSVTTSIKSKNDLINLSKSLDIFLKNISEKLYLESDELKSLKKRICSRVGLGIFLVKYFSFLPSPLFVVIFYFLSPLLQPFPRKKIQLIHHHVQRWRAIFS